ncbi:DUF5050 domain-containing protein [Clostridium tagluense]|uniref:DUF5050 domain-containing protein n=1 Tax=Clostridium tagluense TaxID=360422 RepID=UPI001CF5890A|nr:DUF5050 domain-containing protein [Clostridium tagluense]MCB2299248.1 DUF5050 domain-containing protein [Clostridium tagluense]
MKKNKRITIFKCLLVLFTLLTCFNNIEARADEIPSIKLLQMDHSPLLEGDYLTFFLMSHFENVDLPKAEKVQYRIFYCDVKGNKLYELTNGYTKPVLSQQMVHITPEKTLKPGKYKVSVFVKRDGKKGINSNKNLDYDSYMTTEITCVSKNQKLDLKGDLNIKSQEAKDLIANSADFTIALYKDNINNNGEDTNIICAKSNKNNKVTINLTESGKKKFPNATKYFTESKNDEDMTLTKFGEDTFLVAGAGEGKKMTVKLFDVYGKEIANIQDVVIGKDASGKVADIRSIMQLDLTDSGKKKYSNACKYKIVNEMVFSGPTKEVDELYYNLNGFSKSVGLTGAVDLGDITMVYPSKNYGDVINITLFDNVGNEIASINDVLLQYNATEVNNLSKKIVIHEDKINNSDQVIATSMSNEDFATNFTVHLTDAGKSKFKNAKKYEIFDKDNKSLANEKDINEKCKLFPKLEIGQEITVKLYDDKLDEHGDFIQVGIIENYKAGNNYVQAKEKYNFSPIIPEKSEGIAEDNTECSQDSFVLGNVIKIDGLAGIDKSNYEYKLEYYNIEENMWFTNDNKFNDEIQWIPTEAGKYIIKVLMKPKNGNVDYKLFKVKHIDINIADDGLLAYSNNFVYYGNAKDNYNIYKMSIDKKINQKICDDSVIRVNIEGDWIYYQRAKDSKIFKIKTDGTGKKEVTDEDEKAVCLINDIISVSNILYPPNFSDFNYGNTSFGEIRNTNKGMITINNNSNEELANVQGQIVCYDKFKKEVITSDMCIKEINAGEKGVSHSFNIDDTKNIIYLGTIISSLEVKELENGQGFSMSVGRHIENLNYSKQLGLLTSNEFINNRIQNFDLIYKNRINQDEAKKQRLKIKEKKILEAELKKAKENLKKELKQNNNIPIKFVEADVNRNIIKVPELNIAFKNLTEKTIDGFEISFKCYDSYDKPVNKYGGSGNYVKELVQVKGFASGQTLSYDCNLILYYDTFKIKDLKIVSIHFSDGKVWTP